MLTIATPTSGRFLPNVENEPLPMPTVIGPGCPTRCNGPREIDDSAPAESDMESVTTPENPGIAALTTVLKAAIEALTQTILQMLTNLLSSSDDSGEAPAEQTPPPPPQTPSATPAPCCPSPAAPIDRPGDTGRPSNTFVWKPQSEKDGKLAVVIPAKLTPDVVSVVIRDPKTNKVIAHGRPSGIGNGQRGHYRFSKPGSDYPKKVVVEVQLKSGAIKKYTVNDTSQRTVRN